jgi:hypothetical protein
LNAGRGARFFQRRLHVWSGVDREIDHEVTEALLDLQHAESSPRLCRFVGDRGLELLKEPIQDRPPALVTLERGGDRRRISKT